MWCQRSSLRYCATFGRGRCEKCAVCSHLLVAWVHRVCTQAGLVNAALAQALCRESRASDGPTAVSGVQVMALHHVPHAGTPSSWQLPVTLVAALPQPLTLATLRSDAGVATHVAASATALGLDGGERVLQPTLAVWPPASLQGELDARCRVDGGLGGPVLQDVHLGGAFPASGLAGGCEHLVRGPYKYYHYMQHGFNDKVCGCGWWLWLCGGGVVWVESCACVWPTVMVNVPSLTLPVSLAVRL